MREKGHTLSAAPTLRDKIAIVTGAGAGIGAASARALAEHGATVVVADVDSDAGQRVVESILAAGGTASFTRCDVTNEQDVERLVRSTVDTFGRLDIAHNNAGLASLNAPLAEQTTANWDKIVATNLTGVFLCLRAELQVMIPRGTGSIINTASTAGVKAFANLSPYVATKFGVLGLTKTAAVENGRFGIRVNAVCPGATRSALLEEAMSQDEDLERRISANIPLGRAGQPGDVAGAVVWLASDEAAYVSGLSLMVDGGYTAA